MRRGSLGAVLTRLGLTLATRGTWAWLRGCALAVGAFVLTLGLGALVLAQSYADVRQDRADAIRPTYASSARDASFLASFDGFAEVDDRPVTVISIWPLRDDAPLPPGVAAWPGPGQAVLSPTLQRDLGSARDLYGTVVGTIGVTGLEVPTERRVYLRPTVAAFDPRSMRPAVGYGHSPDDSGYGAGYLNATPRWMVNALVLGSLVLPGLVALSIGAGLDGDARDRRTRFLTALGAARRHRGVVDAAEALPAAVTGAMLAGAVLAVMSFVDVRIGPLDAVLEASSARRVAARLVGAVLAGPVLAVLTVVTVRQLPRMRRHRNALREQQSLPWLRAALFFAFVIGTIWYTARSHSAVLRSLAFMGGSAATALTLPAVVAVALALVGELAGDRGLRRRGSAGALAGGRRLQRFPHRSARLALVLGFAILALGQLQLWTSQLGSQYDDALSQRQQMGTTIARAQHTAYGHGMMTFLHQLPHGIQPLWLAVSAPDSTSGAVTTTLTAPCDALRTLGLPCAASTQLPAAPNPTLTQLLEFGGGSGAYRIVPDETPDLGRLERAGASLVLVSPRFNGLPLDRLQAAAYRDVPGGLQLDTLGQGWVTEGQVVLTGADWTMLLGYLGVIAVGIAGACALAGDVLAGGPPLTLQAALTSRRAWLYVLTGWRTAAPLVLAGLLACLVYLLLPAGMDERINPMTPSIGLAVAMSAVTVALAAASAVWSARRLSTASSG